MTEQFLSVQEVLVKDRRAQPLLMARKAACFVRSDRWRA